MTQNPEEKKYVERVINPDHVRVIFKEGAAWLNKSRDTGEVTLGRIDIQMEPGTYEFKEGDTLQLIGFHNKYRKDPETGEVNERKPHFILRVKRGKKED